MKTYLDKLTMRLGLWLIGDRETPTEKWLREKWCESSDANLRLREGRDAAIKELDDAVLSSETHHYKRLQECMANEADYRSRWLKLSESYIKLDRSHVLLKKRYDKLKPKSRKPAKPKADKDGWIKWGGGKRPVSANTAVCAKFRDGCVDNDPFKASVYEWNHLGGGDDIIAYLVPKMRKTKR